MHFFKLKKVQHTILNKNEEISLGKDERIIFIPNNTTENVRKIVDTNLVLSFVKVIINYFLSIVGKGDTLKVFWVKK